MFLYPVICGSCEQVLGEFEDSEAGLPATDQRISGAGTICEPCGRAELRKLAKAINAEGVL